MRDWLIMIALAVILFSLGLAAFASPVITTQTNIDISVIDQLLNAFDNHFRVFFLLLAFAAVAMLIWQVGSFLKHRKNGGKFVTHKEFSEFKAQNEREHEHMHKSLDRIFESLKHIRTDLQHLTKKVDKCFSEIQRLEKENK